MARIETRDHLRDYILRKLGSPIVEVELTEEHLDDGIDYSIKEFSSFAFDGELEEVVVLAVDGKGTYQLPSFITTIKTLRSIQGFQNYGMNYIPDRWSEEFYRAFESNGTGIDAIISISNTFTLFEKYMNKELHYFFNEYTGQINITEDFTGNIAIHYTYEYVPGKVDKIYNQQWVKDMSVAQARLQQGIITGKYDQALVGGGRINYADMQSRGTEEIVSLREELFSKYAGPAPISIA